MKRIVSVFAVVSLALTGCGGSLCEDVADSLDKVNEKAKPCGFDSTTDPITDDDIKRCEDNLDKCTDADKDALGKFNDCIGDLATCSTGNENAFAAALLACGAHLDKVSDNCGATSEQGLKRSISRFNVSR